MSLPGFPALTEQPEFFEKSRIISASGFVILLSSGSILI